MMIAIVMMECRTMAMRIGQVSDRGVDVQISGVRMRQRQQTDQRERQDSAKGPHHLSFTMLYRLEVRA